jgi:phenylpropionate dioxygenase-like ring-hydroxylating dioxygenase large terminal subunit
LASSSNLLVRQKGDAPFTKDPSVSYTMPARFYTSPDIYEIEKDAIFYKSWHYAGHASQLKEERSYITTSIHDQNIFIAKGSDGELRAFHNVCAHRGHILLEGSGRKSVITCPFH